MSPRLRPAHSLPAGLFIVVALFVLCGVSPVPSLPVLDASTTAAARSTFAYDGEQYGYDQATVLTAGLGVFDSGHRRAYDDRARPAQPRMSDVAFVLAAKAEYVNLATKARTTHILHGDATGVGHLWPGLPGKTPFPKDWSAARVMHEISDVATDPASRTVVQGGKTVVTGTRGGVDIRVIIDNKTGEIVTGYPTNLPRNP